jgi:hypothetical protein
MTACSRRKLGMAEVPCIELIASRVGHSAGHAGNRPPTSLMRSISTRCRSRGHLLRGPRAAVPAPLSSQGQALAKARSATSAVDPDGERYRQQPWLSSLSAVPQARCARNPRLLTDRPECLARACAPPADAASLTQALIEAACTKMKTAPHDLAALTLETQPPQSALSRIRIAGVETTPDPTPGRVTVTTARRFKGLEASLVIVPDVDFRQAEDGDWRRRLYVACSRGRQAVHLITTVREADLGPAVRAFADAEKARPSWRGLARHLGVQLGQGVTDDPFQ